MSHRAAFLLTRAPGERPWRIAEPGLLLPPTSCNNPGLQHTERRLKTGRVPGTALLSSARSSDPLGDSPEAESRRQHPPAGAVPLPLALFLKSLSPKQPHAHPRHEVLSQDTGRALPFPGWSPSFRHPARCPPVPRYHSAPSAFWELRHSLWRVGRRRH